MSMQQPSSNIKWFIGLLISGIVIPIAGIIVALLNPDIRKWLGVDPSLMCQRASCAEEYAGIVKRAKKKLSSFEHHTPIQFPIGINKPLALEIQRNTEKAESGLQAVGYVTSSRVPKQILVKDLHEMFDRHYHLIRNTSSSSQLQSFSPLYVSNNRSLTLLVYDPQTQHYFEFPNVDYISFLKDAINACLNNDITEQNVSP